MAWQLCCSDSKPLSHEDCSQWARAEHRPARPSLTACCTKVNCCKTVETAEARLDGRMQTYTRETGKRTYNMDSDITSGSRFRSTSDSTGPRAMELGAFLGIFSGDRLVAMGGERMAVKGFREISSVATHPEYQGRGYARSLMGALMRKQMLSKEIPFLHVMVENIHAHAIYERMCFTTYKEIPVRVIARVK